MISSSNPVFPSGFLQPKKQLKAADTKIEKVSRENPSTCSGQESMSSISESSTLSHGAVQIVQSTDNRTDTLLLHAQAWLMLYPLGTS